MNKKIFTLLAITVLLLSTAYSVNARSVSDKAVGALVTTLPNGLGLGMYHIQVDSIYLDARMATSLISGGGAPGWYSVTRHENYTSDPELGITYGGTATAPTFSFTVSTNHNDTLVLAVTEAGEVRIISAADLRTALAETNSLHNAQLTDLQATMWCIDVQKTAEYGQIPTFHFMNKIFNMDLDYRRVGSTYVTGREHGWMYSYSFTQGQLNNRRPFYRHEPDQTGNYRVITAQFDTTLQVLTGAINTQSVGVDEFVADTIPGLLKFSIVKISPYVLTATDFNTLMGTVS